MIEYRVTYDSAIPLLGIYPREMKTFVYTKTCTQMFIASLFMIVKRWKQPRCPSMDKWRNKMWYIHTMEYYSAIKRKEVQIHAIA